MHSSLRERHKKKRRSLYTRVKTKTNAELIGMVLYKPDSNAPEGRLHVDTGQQKTTTVTEPLAVLVISHVYKPKKRVQTSVEVELLRLRQPLYFSGIRT